MRQFVRKYIESCIACCKAKRGVDESRYELHSFEKEAIPFQTIHIDYSGPYPKGKGNNEYVFIAIDSFTKFTIIRATKSANTAGAIRVLTEISQYFGWPTVIVADKGSEFASNAFGKFCSENFIKRALVASRTPRANGQAERSFRVIGEALRTMSNSEKGSDWCKYISAIQWTINSSKQRITGQTPQQLLFGYQPRNTLGNALIATILDCDQQSDDDDGIPLDALRRKSQQRMYELQTSQAEQYNNTHKVPRKYKEGDLVLIKWEQPATGSSKKLVNRFRGPYIVNKVLENDRYEIVDTPSTQLTQKPFNSIYAADKIKLWGDRSEIERECFDENGDNTDDQDVELC